MAIVIKKKVSLSFLGDEYKDAYLTFRSIPIKDFEGVLSSMPEENDNIGAIKVMLTTLKNYFLSGEFPDEKGDNQPLTADDIGDLSPEVAIKCFEILAGNDPKVADS